jgi:hypothetical protein
MHDLMTQSRGLSNLDEARSIVQWFDLGPYGGGQIPGKWEDEVKQLQKKLSDAQSLLDKGIELRREESPNQRLELSKDIQSGLDSLGSGPTELPELTMKLLVDTLPAVNLGALENELASIELAGERRSAQEDLKQKLLQEISSAKHLEIYPGERIEDILQQYDKEYDAELRKIANCHNEAMKGDWKRALEVTDLDGSEILKQMRILLLVNAQKWLDEKSNVVLYASDIREINNLSEYIHRSMIDLTIPRKLRERINTARTIDINDLEALINFQNLEIEPWLTGPDDPQGISVEDAIRLQNLKKYRDDLNALLQDLDIKISPSYVSNLKEAVTQINKQKTELQTLRDKSVGLVEETETLRKQASSLFKDETIAALEVTNRLEELSKSVQEYGERLEKAPENIENMRNRLMSLERIGPRIQEKDVFYKLLYSGDHLIIFAVLGYITRGMFEAAYDLLVQEYETWSGEEGISKDATPPSVIGSWKEHIGEICNDPSKMEQYNRWIEGIRDDNHQEILACLEILQPDIGKPLFEYLSLRYSMKYGFEVNRVIEKWWKFYEQGNLALLKRDISTHKEATGPDVFPSFERSQIEEWEDRIKLTEELAKVISSTDHASFKNRGLKDFLPFLRWIVPSRMWRVASKLANQRTS